MAFQRTGGYVLKTSPTHSLRILPKKPRLLASAHLYAINCWKKCKNPTFHIFHLSSIYCAALCCRNASAPGDEWSGGLQMFKKVVFQKCWLPFNLNLHGDICFYPFFFFARQCFTASSFIWKKIKKHNSHHHLFILLHANLILQSGSSLFSSLSRAPLLSTVSPCPAACWHFCLIWLPDHLAHESLPTVVPWTV